jgi:hypothetical protein
MFSSREHAEQLLGYFARQHAEHGHEEDADGIDCARQWASLIAADSPSHDLVEALLMRVASRRDGGSGWVDLQLAVNAWARKADITPAGG